MHYLTLRWAARRLAYAVGRLLDWVHLDAAACWWFNDGPGQYLLRFGLKYRPHRTWEADEPVDWDYDFECNIFRRRLDASQTWATEESTGGVLNVQAAQNEWGEVDCTYHCSQAFRCL